MPTKREWLREQGFTVGTRGRFTQEQLTALADSNLTFDDGIIERTGNKIKAPVKPPAEPGWVYQGEIERPDLPEGYLIEWFDGSKRRRQRWDICYQCGYSIKFCQDPAPVMPPWMVERGAVVLDNHVTT